MKHASRPESKEMNKERKTVGAGIGIMLIKNGKVLLGKRHPDPGKADSSFRS
jgi:hypothetical protein